MGKKQQQQEYVIREIIDRKDETTPKGTIITYYKVLWQGYPDEQATWEKATSLMKSPAVKKDIEKFNNKRKTIQKIKENLPHKVAKKDNTNSKGVAQTKSLVKSAAQPKNKKDILLENNKDEKNDKTIVSGNQNSQQNQKPEQSPKKAQQKNDVVVTKILQKMRENISQKKQQNGTSTEEKEKQLEEKLKSKIKSGPKGKKSKQPKKSITENLLQSKLKKSATLKPIIEQNETQQAIPQPETIPQIQTTVPTISTSEVKEPSIFTVSCVNRIIDQIIEEKSSLQKQVQKPVEDNKEVVNESIKLQLTDELIDHVSLRGRQSLVGPYLENNTFQKDQFAIKGMMVCKNEYFYLVEENGKSEILSRDVMLDKYPYELIVFYEKRINIKPAEINMMVL